IGDGGAASSHEPRRGGGWDAWHNRPGAVKRYALGANYSDECAPKNPNSEQGQAAPAVQAEFFMIVFYCTRCSKELQVEDEFAGQTSRCTTCGQTVQVPLYPVASPVPASEPPRDLSPPPYQAGGPGGSTPLPGPLRAGVDREAATLPPGRSYGT